MQEDVKSSLSAKHWKMRFSMVFLILLIFCFLVNNLNVDYVDVACCWEAYLQVCGGLEETRGLVVVVNMIQVVLHGGSLGDELHHLVQHIMRQILSHEVEHEAVWRSEVHIVETPGVDLPDEDCSANSKCQLSVTMFYNHFHAIWLR